MISASCFDQVALRLCANCSVQVALGKLLRASALCKWLCAAATQQVVLQHSSRSCGIVLRVLLSCLQAATFEPELREYTLRTTFVLESFRHIRTAPQRERFDTHDTRTGFVGYFANSHGSTARAIRAQGHAGASKIAKRRQVLPRRSRSRQKQCSARFLTPTAPMSAEGRKKSSCFFTSTASISAEGVIFAEWVRSHHAAVKD